MTTTTTRKRGPRFSRSSRPRLPPHFPWGAGAVPKYGPLPSPGLASRGPASGFRALTARPVEAATAVLLTLLLPALAPLLAPPPMQVAGGQGAGGQGVGGVSVSFIHELHAQDAFRGSFQRSGPLIGNAVLGVEFEDAFDRERHADGVLLSGIRPGSPAEEAGLEPGDVIVRFNGLDLTEPLDQADEARIDVSLAPPAARLLVLARQLRHGDEVSLVVLRDGQERQVDLTARRMPPHALDFQSLVQRGRDGGTVIVRPAPDALRSDRDTIMVWPRGMPTPPRELAELLQRFSPTQRRFGVQLHDLNEGLARYFGRTEGALVLEVSEDAPLALEPGDVIVAIAGREVEDADHASRILASYRSGEEVEMHVWREGQRVTVRGEAP